MCFNNGRTATKTTLENTIIQIYVKKNVFIEKRNGERGYVKVKCFHK